jgi:hypothetical protein
VQPANFADASCRIADATRGQSTVKRVESLAYRADDRYPGVFQDGKRLLANGVAFGRHASAL